MDKKTKQRLDDISRRYPDTFGACRDHGHVWQPLEAAWLQDGNIERVLACTRCEARRLQYLDKDGYVLANRYSHAKGYLLTGLGRLGADGRAVFRKTAVLKMLG